MPLAAMRVTSLTSGETNREVCKSTAALKGTIPQTHLMHFQTTLNLFFKLYLEEEMVLHFCISANKELQRALRNCLIQPVWIQLLSSILHSSHWSWATEQGKIQSPQENKWKQNSFAWPTLEAGLRSQGSHSCSFTKFPFKLFHFLQGCNPAVLLEMKLLSFANIPQEFCFNKTVVALPEVEEVVLHTEKVIYILKNTMPFMMMFMDSLPQEGVRILMLVCQSLWAIDLSAQTERIIKNKNRPTLFSHFRKIL